MPEATETWLLNSSWRVMVFEELASTNTTAAELAAHPGSDRLVVLARHQTSGRGQYGRVWQSRPGASLLMSAILKPAESWRRTAILTALAAVAVSDAIVDLTGRAARIKWPNDLLICDKKVCGILSEQHGAAAILGIGLNLNQTAEEFLALGLPQAVSLAMIIEKPLEIQDVARAVIGRLDHYHDLLSRGEYHDLEACWRQRLGLENRRVAIEFLDGTSTTGQLVDLSFQRLLLADDHGSVQTIEPETVRHIGNSGV